MDSKTNVSELLLRWEELRERGESVLSEELSKDCPERLEELRRAVQALRSLDDWIAGSSDDNGETDSAFLQHHLRWNNADGQDSFATLSAGLQQPAPEQATTISYGDSLETNWPSSPSTVQRGPADAPKNEFADFVT